MPFNGTGMFVRVRNWVADAAAGVKIRADYHDIEDDGFAAGLSQCVVRDGQSVILQNIPMNGKRITALQDPVDPQDAATKAYADLKLPLTGGTVTGNLDVTGTMSALGYKTRPGMSGALAGNLFNFNYTGNLQVWINNTNIGDLATTAYVEQRASDWAHAIADPKVNRSGDTMTGGLTVNGELVAAATYLRFNYSGSSGYIQWQGGGSYLLGGGGTIWHNGNLDPVQNARWILAADNYGVANGAAYEPYNGAAITGMTRDTNGGVINSFRYRYLQMLRPSGWFTVPYS